MKRIISWTAAAAATIVGVGATAAQTEIALALIPGGPTQVSAAASPPGDPGRMFVLSRNGTIRLYDLALKTWHPEAVTSIATDGSSNGVTGLAFHPRFAENGYFFVWRGNSVVRMRMVGNPLTSTAAEPSSLQQVIRVASGGGQHVGGWIGFDPFDTTGILWISTGDFGNSQNGQRIDNLPSCILRIDIDGADEIPGTADDDGFPEDNLRLYTIAGDNPFVGPAVPGEDEIWAYGLRNPYRCSFDMLTGDFWIGDVGAGRREELDFQPFHHVGLMPGMEGYSGGRNYGWSVWEGSFCNTMAGTCAATAQTAPVAEYPLSGVPFPPLFIPRGSAIIAGYVYRGCQMPGLRGWFVFGDAGSVSGSPDFVWAVRLEDGAAVEARELAPITPSALYGFAQDHAGELYMCGAGGLYRLGPADTSGRDVNNNGVVDSCEPYCGADFNGDGSLDPDDLGDFINGYFSVPPGAGADFNADGSVDPDDLGDFINVYFTCER
ncbi:MAG: sorbosone dehydrogenase family protein [Phycisphaerales bacterium]